MVLNSLQVSKVFLELLPKPAEDWTLHQPTRGESLVVRNRLIFCVLTELLRVLLPLLPFQYSRIFSFNVVSNLFRHLELLLELSLDLSMDIIDLFLNCLELGLSVFILLYLSQNVGTVLWVLAFSILIAFSIVVHLGQLLQKLSFQSLVPLLKTWKIHLCIFQFPKVLIKYFHTESKSTKMRRFHMKSLFEAVGFKFVLYLFCCIAYTSFSTWPESSIANLRIL